LIDRLELARHETLRTRRVLVAVLVLLAALVVIARLRALLRWRAVAGAVAFPVCFYASAFAFDRWRSPIGIPGDTPSLWFELSLFGAFGALAHLAAHFFVVRKDSAPQSRAIAATTLLGLLAAAVPALSAWSLLGETGATILPAPSILVLPPITYVAVSLHAVVVSAVLLTESIALSLRAPRCESVPRPMSAVNPGGLAPGGLAIDLARATPEFHAQDELLFREGVLSPEWLRVVREEAERLEPAAIRMHVPFVRRGGTVGGRVLRREAPALAILYRELVHVASGLVGRQLYEKDEDDDHAVVLYTYRGGDFMRFHHDQCGSAPFGSYSVTVGIVDDSSSRLECRISGDRSFSIATRPGSLTIYNGSRVYHAVTRLGPGERRIVLSGSYRTVPSKEVWHGFVQRAKEGFLYFGWQGSKHGPNGR
jgi:hypothetical protein